MKGRDQADAKVAKSLFQRATGYDQPAEKIFMPAGADEPVRVPYVEHIPPDPQAAFWWLKNRQRKNWRDRQEIEHGVSPEERARQMDRDERRALIEEMELRALRYLEGERRRVATQDLETQKLRDAYWMFPAARMRGSPCSRDNARARTQGHRRARLC